MTVEDCENIGGFLDQDTCEATPECSGSNQPTQCWFCEESNGVCSSRDSTVEDCEFTGSFTATDCVNTTSCDTAEEENRCPLIFDSIDPNPDGQCIDDQGFTVSLTLRNTSEEEDVAGTLEVTGDFDSGFAMNCDGNEGANNCTIDVAANGTQTLDITLFVSRGCDGINRFTFEFLNSGAGDMECMNYPLVSFVMPCGNACIDPVCGNGIPEDGEECDLGDANGSTEPGALEYCTERCTVPQCSDGQNNDGDSNPGEDPPGHDGIDCEDLGCADCEDCAEAGEETECAPWDDDEYDECGDPDIPPVIVTFDPVRSTIADIQTPLTASVMLAAGGGIADKAADCRRRGFDPIIAIGGKACKCVCRAPKVRLRVGDEEVCRHDCPATGDRGAVTAGCRNICEASFPPNVSTAGCAIDNGGLDGTAGDDAAPCNFTTERCIAECVCDCDPTEDQAPNETAGSCFEDCKRLTGDGDPSDPYNCPTGSPEAEAECCRGVCIERNCPVENEPEQCVDHDDCLGTDCCSGGNCGPLVCTFPQVPFGCVCIDPGGNGPPGPGPDSSSPGSSTPASSGGSTTSGGNSSGNSSSGGDSSDADSSGGSEDSDGSGNSSSSSSSSGGSDGSSDESGGSSTGTEEHFCCINDTFCQPNGSCADGDENFYVTLPLCASNCGAPASSSSSLSSSSTSVPFFCCINDTFCAPGTGCQQGDSNYYEVLAQCTNACGAPESSASSIGSSEDSDGSGGSGDSSSSSSSLGGSDGSGISTDSVSSSSQVSQDSSRPLTVCCVNDECVLDRCENDYEDLDACREDCFEEAECGDGEPGRTRELLCGQGSPPPSSAPASSAGSSDSDVYCCRLNEAPLSCYRTPVSEANDPNLRCRDTADGCLDVCGFCCDPADGIHCSNGEICPSGLRYPTWTACQAQCEIASQGSAGSTASQVSQSTTSQESDASSEGNSGDRPVWCCEPNATGGNVCAQRLTPGPGCFDTMLGCAAGCDDTAIMPFCCQAGNLGCLQAPSGEGCHQSYTQCLHGCFEWWCCQGGGQCQGSHTDLGNCVRDPDDCRQQCFDGTLDTTQDSPVLETEQRDETDLPVKWCCNYVTESCEQIPLHQDGSSCFTGADSDSVRTNCEEICPITTGVCRETDNGVDPHNLGWVFLNDNPIYSDVCDDGGDVSRLVGSVQEFSCVSNGWTRERISCAQDGGPMHCFRGACLQPREYDCQKTGGQNPRSSGFITRSFTNPHGENYSEELVDHCVNNTTVYEYRCNQDNFIVGEEVSCASGFECVEGDISGRTSGRCAPSGSQLLPSLLDIFDWLRSELPPKLVETGDDPCAHCDECGNGVFNFCEEDECGGPDAPGCIFTERTFIGFGLGIGRCTKNAQLCQALQSAAPSADFGPSSGEVQVCRETDNGVDPNVPGEAYFAILPAGCEQNSSSTGGEPEGEMKFCCNAPNGTNVCTWERGATGANCHDTFADCASACLLPADTYSCCVPGLFTQPDGIFMCLDQRPGGTVNGHPVECYDGYSKCLNECGPWWCCQSEGSGLCLAQARPRDGALCFQNADQCSDACEIAPSSASAASQASDPCAPIRIENRSVDFCVDGGNAAVLEYSCDNGVIRGTMVGCTNQGLVCQNGACVSTSSSSSSSSDASDSSASVSSVASSVPPSSAPSSAPTSATSSLLPAPHSSAPSQCVPIDLCGNGICNITKGETQQSCPTDCSGECTIISVPEQCDDGNTQNGDGCDERCVQEQCGGSSSSSSGISQSSEDPVICCENDGCAFVAEDDCSDVYETIEACDLGCAGERSSSSSLNISVSSSSSSVDLSQSSGGSEDGDDGDDDDDDSSSSSSSVTTSSSSSSRSVTTSSSSSSSLHPAPGSSSSSLEFSSSSSSSSSDDGECGDGDIQRYEAQLCTGGSRASTQSQASQNTSRDSSDGGGGGNNGNGGGGNSRASRSRSQQTTDTFCRTYDDCKAAHPECRTCTGEGELTYCECRFDDRCVIRTYYNEPACWSCSQDSECADMRPECNSCVFVGGDPPDQYLACTCGQDGLCTNALDLSVDCRGGGNNGGDENNGGGGASTTSRESSDGTTNVSCSVSTDCKAAIPECDTCTADGEQTRCGCDLTTHTCTVLTIESGHCKQCDANSECADIHNACNSCIFTGGDPPDTYLSCWCDSDGTCNSGLDHSVSCPSPFPFGANLLGNVIQSHESCNPSLCGNGICDTGRGETATNCATDCSGNCVTIFVEEGCDDGNTRDGDGCSAECLPENCSSSSVSSAFCGDGITQPPEECDNGDRCDRFPPVGCDPLCGDDCRYIAVSSSSSSFEFSASESQDQDDDGDVDDDGDEDDEFSSSSSSSSFDFSSLEFSSLDLSSSSSLSFAFSSFDFSSLEFSSSSSSSSFAVSISLPISFSSEFSTFSTPQECQECEACSGTCSKQECEAIGFCVFTTFEINNIEVELCAPDPDVCLEPLSSSSSSSFDFSLEFSSDFSEFSSSSSLFAFSFESYSSAIDIDDDGDGDGDDGEAGNDNDDDGSGDDDDGIPGNDDDDGDGDNDDGIKGNKKFEKKNNLVAAGAICGNGILDQGEECDDSNARDDDGCSSTCLLEIGICGDGVVQSLLGEQCENATHDPALPYQCRKCRFFSLSCGDNRLDPGEECDHGALNSTSPDADCRPDCSHSRCGDGILDSTEMCDDGNRLNGDSCDRYCLIESTVVAAEEETSEPVAVSDRGVSPFGNQPMQFDQFGRPLPTQTQFGFPQYPTMQALPRQLPYAQLQPFMQAQGPAGDTGPAAVAVFGAGAAAGWSWMRRRRRHRKFNE